MSKQHYKENVPLKQKEKFAKYLAEGEEIVLVTGFSEAYLRRMFILALGFPGLVFMIGGMGYAYFKHPADSQALGVGLLIGLLLGIASGVIRAVITYKSNRYILTTRRVLVKKGFLSVDLQTAMYDKITHIEVMQHFMDRLLLHHGRLIINTAGVNKNEIILPYVDYPIELKNILERLINREREQLGHQTGSVQTLEGEIVD